MAEPEVLVYRRPGCMFCQQVEDLLAENGIEFRSEEVLDRTEQSRICAHHGALAFPLVLRDGEYVGGFTHIVQLHSERRLVPVLTGRVVSETSKPEDSSTPPRVGSLAGYAAFGKLLEEEARRRGD